MARDAWPLGRDVGDVRGSRPYRDLMISRARVYRCFTLDGGMGKYSGCPCGSSVSEGVRLSVGASLANSLLGRSRWTRIDRAGVAEKVSFGLHHHP
jgi:hypothetical protein